MALPKTNSRGRPMPDPAPADDVETVEDFEEFSTSESLERLLAETGAGAQGTKVHVYLIEPETREEPKIWSGTTDDYDLDTLSKQFGSGRYRIKAYGPHPDTGKYALRLNQVVPCRLTPEADAKLKAMREGRAMPGDAAAITPDAIRVMIAETVRAAQPAQPAIGLRDLVELAKAMQPAYPVQAAVQAAPDPLSMIRVLASAMRDLQPDRDPIDGGVNAGPFDLVMKLVDKFGPLYADAMKAQSPGGAGGVAMLPPGPLAVQQPAPRAGNAGNGAPLQPSPGEDDVMLRLKMGLAFLVNQAESDNDPATYAAVIVDNVPPDDLQKMLAASDWIEQLAKFAPAVANHRKWFEDLKVEVKEEIEERAKGDAPPA